MKTTVQKGCSAKTLAVALSSAAATLLVTWMYRGSPAGSSVDWTRQAPRSFRRLTEIEPPAHLSHQSRLTEMEPPAHLSHQSLTGEQSPALNFRVCQSQPGILNRSALIRSRMLKVDPGRESIKRNMLVRRLSEDYCFCHRTAPFYEIPQPLLPTKNPCWRSEGDSVQCLPYFYIIGFSKCATSDLYNDIIKHPLIHGLSKEPHWLDYLRFYDKTASLQNYTNEFRSAASRIGLEFDNVGSSDFIFGDGTPCTAWHSLKWRCFQGNDASMSEPKYTNADIVHKLNPRARIIAIVRDPVNRLYSRYLTWRKKVPHDSYTHPSPEAFHALSERAVALYTECFRTQSFRSCAYNGTIYTQAMLRVQEGMFSIFLRDWARAFPKEQLMLLEFKNWVADKPNALAKVWSFLGVESFDNKKMEKINERPPINKGSYDIGPMLPKTRQLLEQFYKPFEEDLRHLIQSGVYTLATQ